MVLIGIDVGGMSIKGGITTLSGEILYKATVPTRSGYTQEHPITEDIVTLIEQLLEQSGKPLSEFYGIGIGIPGAIDSKNGVIRYSNNIPMQNVPVVEQLHEHFNLPVHINNDANCAALGEYVYGAGRGYCDVLFVTLGTGVGSGILIGGKLFEGREGGGAECGHMLLYKDGAPCTCGRRGCWEPYASATGLMRLTREVMEKHPESQMHEIVAKDGEVNGKTAFVAARNGDAAGKEVVDTYIRYIGDGLVNLANIFRPDAILIGGGVSHEGAYLTDPLQKIVDEENFGAAFNPRVIVKAASLGNDAGLLGAAALVMSDRNNA